MTIAAQYHSAAIASAIYDTGPGRNAELLLRALAYRCGAGSQPMEQVLRAMAKELKQGVDDATWASDSQLLGLGQTTRNAAATLAADWIASVDPNEVAATAERLLNDATSP